MDNVSKGIAGGMAGMAAHIANIDWELVFVWCALMLVDIVTGYLKARSKNENKSSKMRKGLYGKLNDTFAVVAILLMQEVVIYMGINLPIGPVLLGAFCFKELTSILENTSGRHNSLPVPIRKWINAVGKVINGDEHKKDSEAVKADEIIKADEITKADEIMKADEAANNNERVSNNEIEKKE